MRFLLNISGLLVLLSGVTASAWQQEIKLSQRPVIVHAVGGEKSLPDNSIKYLQLDQIRLVFDGFKGKFPVGYAEVPTREVLSAFCQHLTKNKYSRVLGADFNQSKSDSRIFVQALPTSSRQGMSYLRLSAKDVQVRLDNLACAR